MRMPGARFMSLLALGAASLAGQPARPSLGAISGHVLGADGLPVEGVAVSAIGVTGSSMEQVSDPDGFYRLYNLAPGRYRVRAVPQLVRRPPEIRSDGSAEVRFATTYHPAAATLETAAPVDLGAAAERAGTDIRLVKMPIVAVRGVVSGIPAGETSLSISAEKVQPHRAPNTGRGALRLVPAGDQVKADGTFVLWGLDPGTYILTVSSNGAGWSAAPLPVTVAGKDVDGVTLILARQFDILGRVVAGDSGVRIPATPPNAGLAQHPQIHFDELSGRFTAFATVDADGSFHAVKVQPGQYHISLGWGPYVERVQVGSAESQGNVVDLRTGLGGALMTITASSATAQVRGVVSNANGPVANTTVALLSEDIPVLQLGAVTQPNGAYFIYSVPPGRYKLFAMDGRVPIFPVNSVYLTDYAGIAESIEIHPRERLIRNLQQRTVSPQ